MYRLAPTENVSRPLFWSSCSRAGKEHRADKPTEGEKGIKLLNETKRGEWRRRNQDGKKEMGENKKVNRFQLKYANYYTNYKKTRYFN